MREPGYYKVNYYGTWIVMEYVELKTRSESKFFWTGTIDGSVKMSTDSELFEIGEKVL